MTRVAILLAGVLWAGSAWAACTGANPTWNATADYASVASCVSQAASGSTINVGAGTVSWGTQLTWTGKTLALKGAGKNSTIITNTHGGVMINIYASDSVEISGFQLKSTNHHINITGKYFKIHDNIFDSNSVNKTYGVFPNGTSAYYDSYGVIYNNTFINTQVVCYGTYSMLNATNHQNLLWYNSQPLGSADAIYVEDNTFTMVDDGNVIDGNYGCAYVARFNTISSPAVGYIFEVHAVQSSTNRAVRKWEAYYNTFTGVNSKFGSFFIRAATGVVFKNTMLGSFSTQRVALDSRRAYSDVGAPAGMCDGDSPWDGNEDSTGYPCRDQPGRGPDSVLWVTGTGAYTQQKMPIYIWQNTQPSGGELIGEPVNGSEVHIQENRDYYNYSSATGSPQTSGVRVGPRASRPTGCTTGVGYWATDEGFWKTTTPTVAMGRLYKCTAPNTWTLYYTPYPYPHPLRSGEPPPPVVTIPAAPTGAAVK